MGHIDRLQQAATRSGRLWARGARQCAVAFLSWAFLSWAFLNGAFLSYARVLFIEAKPGDPAARACCYLHG